ncbi:MAG: outer membrane beta-barrel protein [Bacteroidales bacterium]|nr:outer membrane beta-barrel protein [Bacteroidales bacterium]
MALSIYFLCTGVKLFIRNITAIRSNYVLVSLMFLFVSTILTAQNVKWSSNVGSTYSFVMGKDKLEGSSPIFGWMMSTSFENKVSKYTPWLRTKLELGIEQRGYNLDMEPVDDNTNKYDIKRRLNYLSIKPSACYYSEKPFHYLIKVGPYFGMNINMMEKHTLKGEAYTPRGVETWEETLKETFKSKDIQPREWGYFVGFRAGKLFPKERLLFLSLDYTMALTTFDNTCEGCKYIQRNNSVSISGGILMYIKK